MNIFLFAITFSLGLLFGAGALTLVVKKLVRTPAVGIALFASSMATISALMFFESFLYIFA